MTDNQRNTTLKALVDETIVELMPKTTGDQVYLDDTTKLSPKIAEMVSAINLRTKKTEHIADVEILNETIDTKVADAIHGSDTKNTELRSYVDENLAAINASMTSSHTIINDSIASANADIALRAKQTDVDAALELKANKTDVANDISVLSTSVDSKLAEKANATDVNNALDLKANKTDVDSTITSLSTSVESKLAEKANTTDVDTKITNLKQEILGDLPVEAYNTFTELAAYIAEHKELSDSLTEAINTKANKTDVDAALELKANKTDVANDISVLSTSVDSKLAEKANATDVNNALDLKANKTDVDNALELKANKTDVESALSGKVNTSDLVDPGNATITLVQGGAIKGTFTVNQSNNVEIDLDNNNPTYFPMVAASSTEDGKEGLVPAPAAGKQSSFLRGDGTWAIPSDTKYTLESFGVSATAAEINQLGGAKSNIQIQLDSKVASDEFYEAIANVDNSVTLTQAEYDALSDEEKARDITYYITDGNVQPNATAIPFASSSYVATNVSDALNEVKTELEETNGSLELLKSAKCDSSKNFDLNEEYICPNDGYLTICNAYNQYGYVSIHSSNGVQIGVLRPVCTISESNTHATCFVKKGMKLTTGGVSFTHCYYTPLVQ